MNWTTILLYYCKVGSKDVLTSLHGTLKLPSALAQAIPPLVAVLII